MSLSTFITLAVLATGALASQHYYNYYGPDWDMGALYEGLAGLEDDYGQDKWTPDIALQERQEAAAPTQLRDHESLAHSAIADGFQYISGQLQQHLAVSAVKKVQLPQLSKQVRD